MTASFHGTFLDFDVLSLGTALTRVAAYLAVAVYALLPGVSLAECGCPDCACFVSPETGSCCCGAATQQPSCCKSDAGAGHGCGVSQPSSGSASCLCEQHFNGHEPVPQAKRSEVTDDQFETIFLAAPILDIARPQSESVVSVAERDPAAHAPPIHLLNCVWRN